MKKFREKMGLIVKLRFLKIFIMFQVNERESQYLKY